MEILVNKIKFKEIYITTGSFYANGENIFGGYFGEMIPKYGFLSTCCNIRLLTRIIHSSFRAFVVVSVTRKYLLSAAGKALRLILERRSPFHRTAVVPGKQRCSYFASPPSSRHS